MEPIVLNPEIDLLLFVKQTLCRIIVFIFYIMRIL